MTFSRPSPHPLRALLLFLALLPHALPCLSQDDSLLFRRPLDFPAGGKGELRLQVDNLSFARDNEYKGRMVKGYTLPGLWLNPALSYQPLAALRVSAGVHFLHYWGANLYPNLNYSDLPEWKGRQTQRGFHCVPWFRAHLRLSPTLSLLLGSLHGAANHRLAEPLYNYELNLTSDPESGLQMVWDTRPARLDAWVNWESFIFKGDNHQESFTFGLSARFRPSRGKSRTQWALPVQLIFQHRGGEINPGASDRSVKTWLNAAAGAEARHSLPTALPVRLGLEATACCFSQQAGAALPFKSGFGLYAKASAEVWRFRLSLGYWQCHDFITIFGSPFFGAASIEERGLTFRNPRLVTGALSYTQSLGKSFSWGVRADVYNSLPVTALNTDGTRTREGNALSLGAGVYLRIYPDFLLWKRKGND